MYGYSPIYLISKLLQGRPGPQGRSFGNVQQVILWARSPFHWPPTSVKALHVYVTYFQDQRYSTAHGFSCRSPEFAICRRICYLPQNNAELPFFPTFISNSRFFGLLFNSSIYKTIKSSRCKLNFMITMTIMTRTFIINGLI